MLDPGELTTPPHAAAMESDVSVARTTRSQRCAMSCDVTCDGRAFWVIQALTSCTVW